MQLEFRQRVIFTYILPLILMMPSFQHFLAMPEMVGWLSSDITINSAMIMVIWLTPCFALMEFLEWRHRKNPEPPRLKISMEVLPVPLRKALGWLGNLLLALCVAYVALGIVVVILSTFVLDPPYKFWVWGLTAVVIVIFPWRQALASIKNGLDRIRSKIRRPSTIDD